MARVISHTHVSGHDFYTIDVDGDPVKVTVTSTASVVRRWITSIVNQHRRHVYLRRLVVGLGVQWSPGGSDPPADTLQLCVGRRCLIFQLAHADRVPRNLRTFLNHRSHTFVGFWNHSDRRKLENSEHCLDMCRDPLDLRYFAETENDDYLVQDSVEEIVEKCLGYIVEQRREISMSNWYRKHLSNEQIAYATVDAYCAFLVGRNSRVWNVEAR
ncbi:exonuclease 3'-5' domain-containing protein 2-like [Vigna umbellata]|uniref:exonuclease 3'-5' domain-containing protein 2-like n=1 Tax=Vigna umbellata TaxID=87088 RepID=UPI001F5ECA14|nr:exonuclease 3'-5' domain-containing protein 2-like [Vigna umbellata]